MYIISGSKTNMNNNTGNDIYQGLVVLYGVFKVLHVQSDNNLK